jgi:hypothetical protein
MYAYGYCAVGNKLIWKSGRGQMEKESGLVGCGIDSRQGTYIGWWF